MPVFRPPPRSAATPRLSSQRSPTPAPAPVQSPVLGVQDEGPPLSHELSVYLREKKTYGQSKERIALWKHFEPRLQAYGYYIAWEGDTKHEGDSLRPARDPWQAASGEAFASATLGRNGVRWAGPNFWPTLCGAYDRENRFVVIKILDSSSSELKILTELAKEDRNQGNHTIPVLLKIEGREWSFVIMPSWELNIYSHPCWKPAEYLDIALQCLEGLAFMHHKRVAHLDIYSLNIVLNHVTNCRASGNREFLAKFQARFAYIDFGYSVQFDEETHRSQRLVHGSQTPLTYREIPGIAMDQYFDPFAADVYALAKTLKGQLTNDKEHCARFWHCPSATDDLPRVAPEYYHLLDKMMEIDPSKRPTARLALTELKLIRQVVMTRIT